MALESYADYALLRIAGGYIRRFGGLDLETAQTLAGFGSVVTNVLSVAIPAATVHDGMMTLPGGRLFSPWSQAGKRAPVTYPRYSVTIMYRGHVDACIRRYTELLYLAGMTAALYFTYGRRHIGTNYYDYDHYGAKHCQAMLVSLSATADHVLITGATPLITTHFTATAVFQQVGDFANT